MGCDRPVWGVVSHSMGAPLVILGCSRIHHRVFTITAYTSVGCFCALSKTLLKNSKGGSVVTSPRGTANFLTCVVVYAHTARWKSRVLHAGMLQEFCTLVLFIYPATKHFQGSKSNCEESLDSGSTTVSGRSSGGCQRSTFSDCSRS